MNWYNKTKNIYKTSSSGKMSKNAASIEQEHSFVSKKRYEDFVYFTANRIHETSYYVQATCREIDNSYKDLYWMMVVSAFSFEAGNIVYKKATYYRKEEDAYANYLKALNILKKVQQEQEANNVPTASLPSMIWHSLHDIDGDSDLKPTASGNIVYLRQNHNINENKGNLFKNILYLDKAQKKILEIDPKNFISEQEGMF